MSTNEIKFQRRVDGKTIESANPAEIWPNWQGDKERWLFLAPHDDDIVIATGLTFLAAVHLGIPVFAAVTTNGKMGYCRPEQKETISAIREKECRDSFNALGLPENHLYFLNYDDCDLNRQAGRRFAEEPGPTVIAGATGLQNSYVWLLRQVNPTRIFLPSFTDLHPDHKFTHSEMLISIFHAQGKIWPELGPAIPEIPLLYEYAAYSNFLTPPTMRTMVTDEILEQKLQAIYAYKSQEQIDLTISMQRRAGTKEYLREVVFDLFEPEECDKLF